MKKKYLEVLNGLGLVVAAALMMAAGIALIFLVNAIFHTHFK